jgi:cyclopropane-fatty-acyl-phospholipid synthase
MDSGPGSLLPSPATRTRRLRPGLVRRVFERGLGQLETGRLRIELPSGETIERRGSRPGPEAVISFHRWRGVRRLLFNGDVGLAEAYIDGDWTTPDVKAVLECGTRNEAALAATTDGWWLARFFDRLRHRRRRNSRRGSRRNIAAHYDLGNAFYAPWLDRGMNYSSALYTRDDLSLEAAQQEKIDHAIALLDVRGGERVLEIGCGWGAMAETLAKVHRCAVTGITLSTEQLAYAAQRLLPHRNKNEVDVRLQDYRDVEGRFDRIVSIEMLEAVGERYWPTYFNKIAASLAEGGAAVLQAITIDEQRFTQYRARPDFIQRFIFPGGMLPTVAMIRGFAERAGLTLVAHDAFAQSYARTLAEWRRRFLAAWPQIAPLGFDTRFKRMWEYYLAYCEVGFALGAIDVAQFKLVREPQA